MLLSSACPSECYRPLHHCHPPFDQPLLFLRLYLYLILLSTLPPPLNLTNCMLRFWMYFTMLHGLTLLTSCLWSSLCPQYPNLLILILLVSSSFHRDYTLAFNRTLLQTYSSHRRNPSCRYCCHIRVSSYYGVSLPSCTWCLSVIWCFCSLRLECHSGWQHN